MKTTIRHFALLLGALTPRATTVHRIGDDRYVFDLPVVFDDTNSCVFKIGNTLINLLKITAADELIEPARVADRAAGARLVFTISVEDVNALCAKLAARGVTLLNGPMDRPWGLRTASFVDPGGHIWEIAQ